MAPLRSIIMDALRTRGITSRISFWYGARSRRELFYGEELEQLARDYPNFSWHVALSAAGPSDEWQGATGYIHQVVHENYLRSHPDPAACEFYLCGPPAMLGACRAMLKELGVPDRQVFFDDFGI